MSAFSCRCGWSGDNPLRGLSGLSCPICGTAVVASTEASPAGAAPAPPRRGPLAVWAFVCGLLGFVSCGLFGFVGILLGILGVAQIGRPGSGLTGKGMAVAGIVLGAISMVLMPVLAVIALVTLPAAIHARAQAVQAQTVAHLRSIAHAEEFWCLADTDGNGIADYWTGDVSGLYRVADETGNPVALIDRSLALADNDPLPAGSPPRPYLTPLPGSPEPASGYWFTGVHEDPAGLLAQDTDGDGNAWENEDRYAFCAWPAAYGGDHTDTYLLNQEGVVWKFDPGYAAVWMTWPGEDPSRARPPDGPWDRVENVGR